MDNKTENAIAPLVEPWQRRDDLLEKAVTEFAYVNLDCERANSLITLIRNARVVDDVKNDLLAFAASLTQPTTIN
jgi:hypothetical protein